MQVRWSEWRARVQHRRPPLRVAAIFAAALHPVLFVLAAHPTMAHAQSTVIRGRVVSRAENRPVPGAEVIVRDATMIVTTVRSDSAGIFRLEQLPPGVYTIVVRGALFRERVLEGVRVPFTLPSLLAELEPLMGEVIAVSGRPERALSAPSANDVVSAREIAERPTINPLEFVRDVPGMDVPTHGIQSGNPVARGFNNVFSGALHVLTDHRRASVPSLRVNLLHFIPSPPVDIERMEVALGPGSAVWGPNTANGVLHIVTRSPLSDPGTTASLAFGERSVRVTEVRSAHALSDRFGVKISGQFLQADEWKHFDPVEAAERDTAIRRGDPATRIGLRDFDLERWSLDARADWRASDRTTVIFAAGRTNSSSGIEQTPLGAAQAVDWKLSYAQARVHRGQLFAQAYINASDAGNTYLLRDGAGIVDNSKVLTAQVQHGAALGGTSLTYGLDASRTVPETGGTINGANEGDDDMTELGTYMSARTSLGRGFQLVLAGRGDWHSELPHPVFSPRAALMYLPGDGRQAFRLTYNRAFSTPTATQLFLDLAGGPLPDEQLAALGYAVRAQAPGREGIHFRVGGPTALHIRSPFNPSGAGQLLEGNSAVLLQLAAGVLQSQGAIDAQTAAFLRSLQPTDAQVGVLLLDLANPAAAPRAQESVALRDVPRIRESTTTTFELGYTADLGAALRVTANAWYSRVDNFISALTAEAGYLALLNGPRLGAYLAQEMIRAGVPVADAQARAAALAPAIARLPLGIVTSPDVSARGAELLVTFRNFGEVELFGADVGVEVALSDHVSAGATASLVSEDHFVTDGQPLELNAPKRKGSVSVRYDGANGWLAQARLSHTASFPVRSGVYVATRCLGERDAEPCVDSATLLDLTFARDLGFLMRGATVQLGVQNALNSSYRSFPGVPVQGRLALLRLRYDFGR
jgi:iron complex outermembrane receptor protein